jgi:hypothetical protein
MAQSKADIQSKVAARRAEREQAARFATDEQVLITQVVGSIMPDPRGEHTMVVAAFQTAGEFIEKNGKADSIDLTWEINGHHFSAQYWPKRDEQPMDIPAA